jgi:predicted HTH domain antitoxin
MQITIDIPNEIVSQLTATPDQLQRQLIELLVIEAYRCDRITHFQVGQILQLPSRWAVDEFLKKNHADLHYNEEDLASDRQTLRQLKAKNAII